MRSLVKQILFKSGLKSLRFRHLCTKVDHAKPSSPRKKDHKSTVELVQGEILFGIHPVTLALAAGRRTPYKLFVKENLMNKRIKELFALADYYGVKRKYVSGHVLQNLANSRPHQGVCLNASSLPTQEVNLADQLRKEMFTENGLPAVWVMPYKVKDVMNFGAILRSAYYLGVDRVLVFQSDSAPLNAMVSKASAGAMEVIDLQLVPSDDVLFQLVQKWKSCGGKVVGTTASSAEKKVVSLNDFKLDVPILLLSGNEEKGLPAEILAACDTLVYIPTPETEGRNRKQIVDSLNVSVATAIIHHSLLMSRQGVASRVIAR